MNILTYRFKFPRVATGLFKLPVERVRRKGHLVAFVGVDGAGKTSTINYLMGLDYFKRTGVKRVYFGNNEYKIPGLNRMLSIEWKHYPVRLFFSTLGLMDRQLRVLIAQYYICLGYNVLADRYYYDDQIGRLQQAREGVRVPWSKAIYRKIFCAKMFKVPRLTVFLDVSPEVAYGRKQDYSYEVMLKQNALYKEFMCRQVGVFVVDADKDQTLVYEQVVAAIQQLDKSAC